MFWGKNPSAKVIVQFTTSNPTRFIKIKFAQLIYSFKLPTTELRCVTVFSGQYCVKRLSSGTVHFQQTIVLFKKKNIKRSGELIV